MATVTTWVAFLRGINVGGRHRLPMTDLRDCLVSIGCTKVRTYIQSGNVVFVHREIDAGVLAGDVGNAIMRAYGFRPEVVLLTTARLQEVVCNNPFPDAAENPATLGIYFLATEPSAPDLAGMENIKLASEQFRLKAGAFYLLAPDGVGRSKLAANVEKHLGVIATARNLRTALKVLDMVATSKPGSVGLRIAPGPAKSR